MKRSEQKIQDTWKMEDMFISDEAWEKDFEKATKMIPHYSDFSGEECTKDNLWEINSATIILHAISMMR